MIVAFENVGVNKESWTSICNAISYDWLCKQIKTMAGIAVDNICFTADGYIFAGQQQVGTYKLIKPEGEQQ